ncbi:MAG: hypothetical protein ABIH92_00010 [Nanoarchaeota archaeon]
MMFGSCQGICGCKERDREEARSFDDLVEGKSCEGNCGCSGDGDGEGLMAKKGCGCSGDGDGEGALVKGDGLKRTVEYYKDLFLKREE